MIEKDLPISSNGDDRLYCGQFAERLADMIKIYVEEQDAKSDGIGIGVKGPWGSGKTSLFNLVETHLFFEAL